jgi:hypothetical protein
MFRTRHWVFSFHKSSLLSNSIFTTYFRKVSIALWSPALSSKCTFSKMLKSKSSPTTHLWRRRGERIYSSYSFTTSVLDGDEWSVLRPVRALPPEKGPRYHWTGGWVGPRAGLETEVTGKILSPLRGSNPDRLVVQPVARHYTDWANPAHF